MKDGRDKEREESRTKVVKGREKTEREAVHQ